MIRIEQANIADSTILALIGRITYAESHGHFISNEEDLAIYSEASFSMAKTKALLEDPDNLFYLLYLENLPIGYAKLNLNASHESITALNNARLERIYILNYFIGKKLGQHLFDFVVEKVKALNFKALWLSVYVKNERAINFYKKNDFKPVGNLLYTVNGKDYDNIVFSKNL